MSVPFSKPPPPRVALPAELTAELTEEMHPKGIGDTAMRTVTDKVEDIKKMETSVPFSKPPPPHVAFPVHQVANTDGSQLTAELTPKLTEETNPIEMDDTAMRTVTFGLERRRGDGDFGLDVVWNFGIPSAIVRSGSPAARAGLMNDDVIVGVNNLKPQQPQRFSDAHQPRSTPDPILVALTNFFNPSVEIDDQAALLLTLRVNRWT